MQLTASDLDWDDELPPQIAEKWIKWITGLDELKSININRCIKPATFGKVVGTDLHIFGDASKVGYGACSPTVLQSRCASTYLNISY